MTDPVPPPSVPRSHWALAAAIVAVAAVLMAVLPTSSHGADPSDPDATSQMLAVAPGGSVELASLSADHQALYLAAAADPEGFEAVACYCGCESFLDHRHLLDCFVRPDGGWERHATGCAVCLAEARDVIDMRGDGTPLEEIVRTIDGRFGGITDTATA